MAAAFASTATQALLSAPAKMASCARMASRPSNTFVPFATGSSLLTARVTEPNFRRLLPMATSAAKETRNEDAVPETTGKEGQAPTLPRQQSLSLLDSWDPFSLTTRSLRRMMETMDRLFSSTAPSTALMGAGDVGFRLPWDVVEEDENFHMRIDIPGFSKEEVKVRVEDGVLVVEAERKTEEQDKKWEGRSYGKFYTRIDLPENVETEKVAAKFTNGVLELTVPKIKGQSKQVIDVKLDE